MRILKDGLQNLIQKIDKSVGCMKHAHSGMCVCTKCERVYCFYCQDGCECQDEKRVDIPEEKHEEKYGTTGKVDWSVRIIYNMLNKSPYKDGVQEFTIGFSVVAETVKEAWEEALEMFQEEMTFDERIYGRTEMSVKIES